MSIWPPGDGPGRAPGAPPAAPGGAALFGGARLRALEAAGVGTSGPWWGVSWENHPINGLYNGINLRGMGFTMVIRME